VRASGPSAPVPPAGQEALSKLRASERSVVLAALDVPRKAALAA